MEPVTHVLTGACLARAGLNRRAAYATVGMAIAAEFPDIDTLWGLRGPITGFEHHRGITHTFLGLPFEAALLLLLFMGLHQWRLRRRTRPPSGTHTASHLNAAPFRWATLYGLLLLALASHLLLDYTNNYGIRPFFPFNAHWYAASIVFIFDPCIFLLFIAGLSLPRLFALVAEEVGFRRTPFRGAGWARAALIGVAILWLFRGYERQKAIALAGQQTVQAPETVSPVQPGSVDPSTGSPVPPALPRQILQARHSLASPDAFSIFRWYIASDFGPVYALATADTWNGTLTSGQTLTKPAPGPILTAAEGTHLGHVYLDWSAMPWMTVSSIDSASSSSSPASQVTVTFQDLRFKGGSSLLQRGGKPPLTGTVVLDASGATLLQVMDGRPGH